MNFFKTKTRTPTDLVRGLRDNILKLESAPPGEPRKKVRHFFPRALCPSPEPTPIWLST
jgi:calcium binding protein 39